jgi:hypothetical protein
VADALAVEQADGGGVVLGQAGLVLLRLLADVHLDWPRGGLHRRQEGAKVVRRHGAHRVGGEAGPRQASGGVGGEGDAQLAVCVEVGVGRSDDEALLGDAGGAVPAGAGVGAVEQADAQADLPGGADDGQGHGVGLGIGAAGGIVVEKMGFAHGGDPGERHFRNAMRAAWWSESGSSATTVRNISSRQVQSVSRSLPARYFGAAADQALETVGMGVDQAGQEGAAGEALRGGEIGGVAREAQDAALGIGDEGQIGLEARPRVQQVGQPDGGSGRWHMAARVSPNSRGVQHNKLDGLGEPEPQSFHNLKL